MLKSILRRTTATATLSVLLPVGATSALPVPAAVLLAVPALVAAGSHARAESSDSTFVQSLGDKLVTVVNGPGTASEKKTQIQPILDQNVDVDAIGRTCLGRFWRVATPAQQQRYLALFHQVLVNVIGGKLGEYKGVTFTVGGSQSQQAGVNAVSTVIVRPGQPPANVDFLVSHASGSPKVTDVIAEGVSLSLTQRSDYASYLSRNGDDIDKLLAALSRQVAHAT